MTDSRRLLGEEGLRQKGITYSRAQRIRLIKAGKFPRPVPGAGKSNAWLESEVDEFIAALIKSRDQKLKATSERMLNVSKGRSAAAACVEA